MGEKKDKDLWEKISDAASRAGEAIGDEVEKLKLTHDLSVIKRQLRDVYAEIGRTMYKRYWDNGGEIDEEFLDECKKIDDLRRKVSEIEEKRKDLKGFAPKDSEERETVVDEDTPAEEEPEFESPADGTKLEFMDDEEIPGFCPQCGYKVDLESGRMPKFCIRCGESMPTEWS
jgi:hypothetical protein